MLRGSGGSRFPGGDSSGGSSDEANVPTRHIRVPSERDQLEITHTEAVSLRTRLSPVATSSNSTSSVGSYSSGGGSHSSSVSSFYTHSSSSLSSLHSMTLSEPSGFGLRLTSDELGGNPDLDPCAPVAIGIRTGQTPPSAAAGGMSQRKESQAVPKSELARAASSAGVGRAARTEESASPPPFTPGDARAYNSGFRALMSPQKPQPVQKVTKMGRVRQAGARLVQMLRSGSSGAAVAGNAAGCRCNLGSALLALLYLAVLFLSFYFFHMLSQDHDTRMARGSGVGVQGMSPFGSLAVHLAPSPVFSPFMAPQQQNQLRLDVRSAKCSEWMDRLWPHQSWHSSFLLHAENEESSSTGGKSEGWFGKGSFMFADAAAGGLQAQPQMQQQQQQYVDPSHGQPIPQHPQGHHLHANAYVPPQQQQQQQQQQGHEQYAYPAQQHPHPQHHAHIHSPQATTHPAAHQASVQYAQQHVDIGNAFPPHSHAAYDPYVPQHAYDAYAPHAHAPPVHAHTAGYDEYLHHQQLLEQIRQENALYEEQLRQHALHPDQPFPALQPGGVAETSAKLKGRAQAAMAEAALRAEASKAGGIPGGYADVVDPPTVAVKQHKAELKDLAANGWLHDDGWTAPPAAASPPPPQTAPKFGSAPRHSAGSLRVMPLLFFATCSGVMLLLPSLHVIVLLLNAVASVIVLTRQAWAERAPQAPQHQSQAQTAKGRGSSSSSSSSSGSGSDTPSGLLSRLRAFCCRKSSRNGLAPPRPLPTVSVSHTSTVGSLVGTAGARRWAWALAFCVCAGCPAYVMQQRHAAKEKRGKKGL